jgi:hypothetical protein
VAGDARGEILQHDGATGEVRRTMKRPQGARRQSSPKKGKRVAATLISGGRWRLW